MIVFIILPFGKHMANFFNLLSKAYPAINHYHPILNYLWVGVISLQLANRLNDTVRQPSEQRERERERERDKYRQDQS
jgi:hypothetical protein